MIFADNRFMRSDKRSKLPKWILQFLHDSHYNLSTDMAVAHVKSFLRLMGQPIDQDALRSVLLSEAEIRTAFQSRTSSNDLGHVMQSHDDSP
jgi:DNA excision repair protein ERCC-2